MKFSFVIPVFNTEQYLPRCLDSLVAQTDGCFKAIDIGRKMASFMSFLAQFGCWSRFGRECVFEA